jgi:hypothetical protein
MTIARTDAEWARTSAVMTMIVTVAPYLSVSSKNQLLAQIRSSLRSAPAVRPPQRKMTVDQLAAEMCG